MGALVIVLLTAGFTAYTLMSPALGVVLWVAALIAAGAGAFGMIRRRSAR